MENDPRTYAVIGAAMEVHKHLGCGFLEAVYQEALEMELTARGIPFRAQVELPIWYKGRVLKTFYKADVLSHDAVVVELKALSHLTSNEEAQVLNYPKATGYDVGLLLNFGRTSLQYKRLVRSQLPSDPDSSS
jgi:GxxExxY protein